MEKIENTFFSDNDTLWIARNLLGKVLVSNTHPSGIMAGVITETEAYLGKTDKASHAFGSRRTQRTETMYKKGGCTYIYLCYGIHHLLNIVTADRDIPHAVLLRAITLVDGMEVIQKILNKKISPIINGPGRLTKAMNITTQYNGISLCGNTLWLENRDIEVPGSLIKTSPRIGIDYAGSDAELPYRFYIDDVHFLHRLPSLFNKEKQSK